MLGVRHQFRGFLDTPFLVTDSIFDINTFKPPKDLGFKLRTKIPDNLRLGKLVERFVSAQLNYCDHIEVLAENVQIQDGKITVGEIDCLLLENGNPIHLEIIYKFYLYDASVGDTEIERWIGPNRRDSFIQKLTKLKQKQLPLLYHPKTQKLLASYNLNAESIRQRIYFKAQLFVPLENYKTKVFSEVNNACIVGFYLRYQDLAQFKECKFYIPTKHNWLVAPLVSVEWLQFENFIAQLSVFLKSKNAPLCWIKQPNGQLFKCIVVWWV